MVDIILLNKSKLSFYENYYIDLLLIFLERDDEETKLKLKLIRELNIK